MPEKEFELYLSLLSRFLRLNPDQREQISDELRDHFDERLEELLAAGLAREEAIRAALDEFGDAAGLAAHFSNIGNSRRRRTLMRCTLGTAVGLAVAIFLALTFWPETPVTPGPSRAEAQQAPKKEDQPALPRDSNTTAAVEAKLSTRLPEVKFVETPLADVLEYLSDAIQVDILFNKRALEDLGIPTDTQITLQVKHAPVTVRTALELALEQVSGELGYTVRDGLVYITQKFDNDEIQVYNVRDLLKGVPAALTRPGAPAAPGGFGGASAAGGEGAGMGMMSGGLGVGKGTASVELLSAGEAIREVITSTIHPDTWSSVGGVGSLAEFNGLLIVKQSQTVHREIHQLLQMMREEDHAGALSSTRKP